MPRETYIDRLNKEQRFLVASFKLQVTTLSAGKIQNQAQHCRFCNTEELENEIHIVTRCAAFKISREKAIADTNISQKIYGTNSPQETKNLCRSLLK